MKPLDYRAIDEVIHGRVRLAVMSFLMTAGQSDFVELRQALDVTDGNLGAQLRKLEEHGYVEIRKGYVGRKPHSAVLLTEAGRAAMQAYLGQLRALLEKD